MISIVLGLLIASAPQQAEPIRPSAECLWEALPFMKRHEILEGYKTDASEAFAFSEEVADSLSNAMEGCGFSGANAASRAATGIAMQLAAEKRLLFSIDATAADLDKAWSALGPQMQGAFIDCQSRLPDDADCPALDETSRRFKELVFTTRGRTPPQFWRNDIVQDLQVYLLGRGSRQLGEANPSE